MPLRHSGLYALPMLHRLGLHGCYTTKIAEPTAAVHPLTSLQTPAEMAQSSLFYSRIALQTAMLPAGFHAGSHRLHRQYLFYRRTIVSLTPQNQPVVTLTYA